MKFTKIELYLIYNVQTNGSMYKEIDSGEKHRFGHRSYRLQLFQAEYNS